jgi:hypothetical protein
MGLFQRAKPEPTWEEQYPCTVVLRTDTEDAKSLLLQTLAQAALMLVQAEPENWAAQQTYAAIRSYLPPPAKPRSANIIQFPARQGSRQ